MADEIYKHLLLRPRADINKYTNPSSFVPDEDYLKNKFKTISIREEHGQSLLSDLEKAKKSFENQLKQADLDDVDFIPGMKLTFESWEGFELKFESLEDVRSKIEILSIKEINNKFFTTVRIPEGKLELFIKKIRNYLDSSKDREKGVPSNNELIANIEKIKLAALENYWSDSEAFPKDTDKKFFLEAWLRVGENRDSIINRFKEQAVKAKIFVSEKPLKFPETTVFLIRSSINQLKHSILLLDCISEIRIFKDTPASFLEMDPIEEAVWGENFLERVTLGKNHKNIAVCILDTGVNYSHPFLAQSITENDADSYFPNWEKSDHAGHGTEMGGLALYGDLYPILLNKSPIILTHSLESVKILPPNGSNLEDLYGVITKECVARAELLAIERKRVFNLAITSRESINQRGEPTSWSATIDNLAFGNEEEKSPKRLFLISAGNLEHNEINDYPNSNELSSVQNPAQAWNCITVGAFTEKVDIEKTRYPELNAIAKKGELSPTSTTSFLWNEYDWPIKPEIVMEGGNYAKDKKDFITSNESLSLISTRRDFQNKLLTQCLDTSAATAQASRYAALVASEYPEFWPETIRGLLVHSADYQKLNLSYNQIKKENQTQQMNILRKFGYGHPDLIFALNSGKSFCTLIIQDELQPFIKDEGNIKTNEIRFYNLPLPVKALETIYDHDVELKVTLSYFIEPNIKKINTKYTKTYSSCALRFDSIAATEDIETFKKRINKDEREKLENGKYESNFSNPENNQWVFGSKLRTFGSIHSDVWLGTAAQLAKKESICVYPIGGWWKTRKQLGKFNNNIRFSLLVTIKTKSSEVDIYSEIKNKISIELKPDINF
ncbi:S8 family peptidase [Leptospira kanakyensis]|uniref:S8 family peptidase n=1 Tax=Leptospira kanakyensis TaxID=2484968 RepID=UPI00223DF8C8|nr:S8 family peptidase [Leptospira kanakyensis]MCW7469280.1 S8 family peptidase [Leptospira kanakyensis]